jgi:threonine dehydratase
MNITDCYLRIGVETRNFEHIVAVKRALTDAGFKVCE